jgi:hypothetical protein
MQDLVSSSFYSFLFNMVPPKLNVLCGTLINDIETILVGGLGPFESSTFARAGDTWLWG